MRIEQFACTSYDDMEKAPCGSNCIRKAETTDTVSVCLALQVRYVETKDFLETK